MMERFSRLRGRTVRSGSGHRIGFVLDVIVRPRGEEMLATQLVIVAHRFDLLAARFMSHTRGTVIEIGNIVEIAPDAISLKKAS